MPVNRKLALTIVYALMAALLVACSSAGIQSSTVKVFAASSLHDAMNQLMTEFQGRHPEVEFQSNYASSAQLAIQISQGAAADVFASADLDQMVFTQNSGEIESESFIFATNELLILVPAENPAGIQEFQDLGEMDLRLILTVPGTPLRAYSDQVLEMLANRETEGEALVDRLMANVVSEEENARQAVAKIALGEADAAFAYHSDAVSALAQDSLSILLPASLQVRAEYPIALTTQGQTKAAAEQFVDFVLSPEGQQIMAEWGFGPRPQP